MIPIPPSLRLAADDLFRPDGFERGDAVFNWLCTAQQLGCHLPPVWPNDSALLVDLVRIFLMPVFRPGVTVRHSTFHRNPVQMDNFVDTHPKLTADQRQRCVVHLPGEIVRTHVYAAARREKLVLHARDIPDLVFLQAIRDINERDGTWATVDQVREVLTRAGLHGDRQRGNRGQEPLPRKLVLAKARRLEHRGWIDGCTCGCYGGFTLTDAGRESWRELRLGTWTSSSKA
ncbi:hypothetical protein [Nocardia sp. NPDC127526]|uniref:hypothetical protein n=1 Tax=Nocardia sp. NPDC127526 TaxID=3345393 RepID=UPI003628324C